MKQIITFSIIILLVVQAGCGRNKRVHEIDGYITVDVSRSYPKMELILQDFMDVEYIKLETTDDFITQGVVMDVGKEIIVVRNRIEDGDIFIFERATGKGLRKINRKGQGPEEYIFYMPQGFLLDEENEEMFVNSPQLFSFSVYDLHGQFKRSIRYKENVFIMNAFSFDTNHILCEEIDPLELSYDGGNPFYLISKQDGSMKDIRIPINQYIPTSLVMKNEDGRVVGGAMTRNCRMSPFKNTWILTHPSSDTVFQFLPEQTMNPFIVRTPSIQSMNPAVFLFPGVLNDRYYFMQTAKKELDFTKQDEFPTTDLVYDRNEKMMYNSIVYNADYSTKTINMAMRPVNNETFYVLLEAYELVEAYNKGELQGRLKEIAAELNEEDNPVIMLIKKK